MSVGGVKAPVLQDLAAGDSARAGCPVVTVPRTGPKSEPSGKLRGPGFPCGPPEV